MRAETADTGSARQRGLMFRETLGHDEGMLFMYDREDIFVFWMKNTTIPLDMIWISRGKRIVHIVEHAQPCSGTCENIVPPVKAQYLLEVNAGFVRQHKLSLGDRVDF